MEVSFHVEMIAAKASRTFFKVYCIFKSESSGANFKVTLHKALIRSVMTYACPICEFVADTQLLKLKPLQIKFLRIVEKLPKHILVRDLHSAFNLPYLYYYITKLCRRQAEII
jgi:hypothetical protein